VSPRRVEPTLEESLEEEQGYLFLGGAPSDPGGWADSAACRDADPEHFFPIGQGDVASREAALSCCRVCPVVNDCLAHALRDRTLHGIWGGTDEVQREALRRGDRHRPVRQRDSVYSA
jgi:WhiB family redox-sensing transcriptional regulator